MKDINEQMMEMAYHQAELAYQHDEVPVGCVITYKDKVLVKTYNHKERNKQSLYHCEVYAIHQACIKLKSKYLNDCNIYVTLEPCLMCTGALIQSRIKGIYFGAYDPKGGCIKSFLDIDQFKGINHHPTIVGGILQDKCSQLIKQYFKEKRR